MDYNKKLIQVVRLHEFIYDSQHPHYGDNALKNETWKEIAGLLQVSVKECKKSWILLREGYRRNLKKRKAFEIDPACKDKELRKWIYEDDLSFLEGHLKQRGHYLDYTYKHEDINIEDDNLEAGNGASSRDVKKRGQKRSRTHETAARRSCSHDTNSNHLIKYLLDKTTKRSDIHKFFDSLASTVLTFSPRNRAIAKAKVFEIVSRMELDILDSEQAPPSHSKSAPVADTTEVTQSTSVVDSSPLPEPPVVELIESSDDEELVMEIKVEPEQFLEMQMNEAPYT